MTDRELLELAAKAAGLEFDPTVKAAHGLMVVRGGAMCQSDQVLWNPLTDDGDALRLAVKLGIQIDPRNPETRVFGPVGERVDEYHKPDAFAATRRAIVRAAAEIGKAMP
jgi:hypothetical protein